MLLSSYISSYCCNKLDKDKNIYMYTNSYDIDYIIYIYITLFLDYYL